MSNRTRCAQVGWGGRAGMYARAIGKQCRDRCIFSADMDIEDRMSGDAANRAIVSGRPERPDALVPGLARPDYPVMPEPTDPLPLPPRRC